MALEVGIVGTTLLHLVDNIQRFGNNHYKASKTWQEFPQQVQVLRAKHASLEAQLERFGLLEGLQPWILDLLKTSKNLMLEEVATLQRRRARSEGDGRSVQSITTWRKRLAEVLFPEKLGIAAQNAITAYDQIQAHFKSQQEGAQTMRDIIRTRPIPLSFAHHNQDNYVPLGCESRIYSALSEAGETSPTVVLLYGGPGKGKSTVARQVSLSYEKDKSVFAQVIMLECGVGVDLQSKQMQLLQRLGWDDSGETSEKCSNQDDSSVLIHGRLQNLLRQQKVLIVLDDVWESHFVQSLLNVSGARVKYLITSQYKNLCKDLDCKFLSVQIDDLEQSDARRILAVHIGFPHQQIPDHLQEMADQFVHQAEGIPLVIATLGAQIGKAEEDIDNLELWKCALKNCIQCLNTDRPSKFIAGGAYSRSYWSAMKQSINELTVKAKELLLLISMCKGPAVSQDVLHFFCCIRFRTESCNIMQFSQWKTELKSRHLVFEKDKKLLSVHSLTKGLVMEYLEDSLESIVHSLVESVSPNLVTRSGNICQESQVIAALVCLYLDTKFWEQLALQACLKSARLTETKRRIIEPITELLGLEVISSGNWSGELHMSSRQVFLHFIYNNKVDANHISRLLGSSVAIKKTLNFLENASLLSMSAWPTTTTRTISCGLLKVYQDASHPFQVHAANTLASLSSFSGSLSERNREVILDIVIHQVVQSLSHGQKPDLQSSSALLVACVFRHPRKSRKERVKQTIAMVSLLETLGILLLDDQNPALQRNAACALATLGLYNDSFKGKILNLPGVLDTLVRLQDSDESADIAYRKAKVLAVLADTQNSEIKLKMGCHPDLLESLGLSLSNSRNSAVRQQAALALAHLGVGHEGIAERISKLPGLLDNLVPLVANFQLHDTSLTSILSLPGFLNHLVKLLDQSEDCNVAEEAAMVICRMASLQNSTKSEIACYPNLLEILAISLPKADNPALQCAAALALANLCAGDLSIKEKILNVPQLLDHFVTLVNQVKNSGAAEHSARAIASLAATEDSAMKRKIACCPNLLESLGASLCKDMLKRHAAAALADLGLGEPSTAEKIFCLPGLQDNIVHILADMGLDNRSIRRKFIKFPGLLDHLVTLVVHKENSDLAEDAVKAIGNLAADGDSTMKRTIASFPNLRQSMGAKLGKDDNPSLQLFAAEALVNLGCQDQSTVEGMLSFPGLLDILVKSMKEDQNSDLIERAVRAVQILTSRDDLTAKMKIAHFPNLLERIGITLCKREKPALQRHAVSALADLVSCDQLTKERICNLPGVLEELVDCMDQEENSRLAEEAARAIAGLAASEDSATKIKIACFPSLLESLETLLSSRPTSALKWHAAVALANLGCCENVTKEKVLSLPRLFDNLVHVLAQVPCRDQSGVRTILNVPGLWDHLLKLVDHENPRLAKDATIAFARLAATDDSVLEEALRSSPTLLQCLGVSLSKAQSPDLQAFTVKALATLGSRDQSSREEILNLPGVLDSLVKLLDQDWNSNLTHQAALTIRDLASEENSLKLKIASFPNLLKSLGLALAKRHNPVLQRHAAAAISKLADGDHSTKEKIVNMPGLMDSLLISMDEDHSSVLAHQAVRTIRRLAGAEDSTTKRKIAGIPKLLESLKGSLLNSKKLRVRSNAAAALADLGCWDQLIEKKIFDVPGLLDDLVKTLDQSKKFDHTLDAAMGIRSLASVAHSTKKRRIAGFPNLLESLGVSLSRDRGFELPYNAAAALAHLGSADDLTKEEILNLPGLLKNLVKLLDQEQNSEYAEQAATTIRGLAATKNSRMKETMASSPELLDSLRAASSKLHIPGLASIAASALGNLGFGEQ